MMMGSLTVFLMFIGTYIGFIILLRLYHKQERIIDQFGAHIIALECELALARSLNETKPDTQNS